MMRKASFMEAGYDPSVYNDFYSPTSEFAHGEPSRYVMRNPNDEWVFGRSDEKESRYLIGAFVSSTGILLEALERINQTLSLPFSERLNTFKKPLFAFVLKWREGELKKVPAAYLSSSKPRHIVP